MWDADGAESLRAFNGAKGITTMGWFEQTGADPGPGYGAIGLAGLLSGDSGGRRRRVPDLSGSCTVPGDPWQVDGTGASATDPRGIKVGGSFPQDTAERNPCACRVDSLMSLDVAASAEVVAAQFRRFTRC